MLHVFTHCESNVVGMRTTPQPLTLLSCNCSILHFFFRLSPRCSMSWLWFRPGHKPQQSTRLTPSFIFTEPIALWQDSCVLRSSRICMRHEMAPAVIVLEIKCRGGCGLQNFSCVLLRSGRFRCKGWCHFLAALSWTHGVSIDCCCVPVVFPLTGLLHQLVRGRRRPAEILRCLIVCDSGPIREVFAFIG